MSQDKREALIAVAMTVVGGVILTTLTAMTVAVMLALAFGVNMLIAAAIIWGANFFGAGLPFTWMSVCAGGAIIMGLRMALK